MTQKLLRRAEVTERYGIPRSTLYDLIAKGRFPRPVKVSPRFVAWRIEDLTGWEESLTE
ncbi:helix-turn-helix transcriptional regulator [Parvibaculum sp. MBR-TMA-1.3b-4.2]